MKGETADAEWRRLLKGAFAFQKAPFASHPLDQRRAVQMRAVARHTNVKNTEIITEALSYLSDGTGVTNEQIDSQLAALAHFLNAERLVKRSNCLWLVFWNSDKPLDPIQSKLVAAFDSRRSLARISEFLEEYYWSTCGSLTENLHYATRLRKRPYRSSISSNEAQRTTTITCGHNPWLEARVCRNVCVMTDSLGNEFTTWD